MANVEIKTEDLENLVELALSPAALAGGVTRVLNPKKGDFYAQIERDHRGAWALFVHDSHGGADLARTSGATLTEAINRAAEILTRGDWRSTRKSE